jgi:hypothetical protein
MVSNVNVMSARILTKNASKLLFKYDFDIIYPVYFYNH